MSQIAYIRTKANADRTIRAYLSLDCNGGCAYCSAGVQRAPQKARDAAIAPEVWAEGINRRNRECILAGGEPFLYPHLAELVNVLKVRTQIYTNLKCDVNGFLRVINRPLAILASCHVMNATEKKEWLCNTRSMIAAGHHVRIHLVKSEGWRERVEFIRKAGIENRITACDDQRGGIKSRGQETNDLMPNVTCKHRIFLYGPDGYRYHCVTQMVQGVGRLEHIGGVDGDDWTTVAGCKQFGLCVGCDNNIEGEVRSILDEKRY